MRKILSLIAATCLLEGAPESLAQFTTHTWTGATDTNWNEAGNWNPAEVPGLGDTARFDDTAASASINVPPGQAFDQLLFANSTLTFTLNGGDMSVPVITHSGSSTNTVTSRLTLFGESRISRGELNLLNPANSATGGVDVRITGGRLGVITSGSASGIGNATIHLEGGTLDFIPADAVRIAGLEERWYNLSDFACGDAGPLFDMLHVPLTTNNPVSYLNRSPDAIRPLDRTLDYNAAAMNARSGGIVGTDLVGGFWTGFLNVGPGLLVEPGKDVTFGTRSDDGSVLWLDINQNGTFDDPDELVVDNQRDHGARNRVGSVTNLAAGSYAIGIGFWERCGGEFMGARIGTGVVAEAQYNNLAIIDPSSPAQAGLWSVDTIAPGSLSNAVTLASASTISLSPGLFGVTLGELTVTGEQQLTVASEGMSQVVDFSSASLSGNLTLSQTNMSQVTLSNVSETSTSGLIIDGDGIVSLATSNSYSGATIVQSNGTLEVRANHALGTTAGATDVQAGGSLRLSGAFDYAALENLTLAGPGSAKSAGALNHNGGGNTEWRGPIVLSDDATIYNSQNVLSVHHSIDNAGFELHFDVRANDVQIEGNALITGAGDIRLSGGSARVLMFNGNGRSDFDGDLTVESGIWDARGDDSLGSTVGHTRVVQPGRLELRDNLTLADDIFISGNGNNAGAIRSDSGANTLTGVVTLEGDNTWVIRETSLAVSNQVAGAFNLTKQDTGTLALYGDNTFNSYIHQGGELRIGSANALGGTTNLNMQHAGFEFDGDVVLDGTSPLQDLSVGNTIFRPISGSSLIDIPLLASTTHYFAVSGDGDLDLVTPLGVPGSQSIANGLNHYGYHLNNDGLALNLAGNRGMMNGGQPRGFDVLFHAVFLENGPANRGLDFNDDADFINSGAVGQNDNFSNLFLGYLNVLPGAAGTWILRVEQRDDPVGMWIDLDQDGIFESSLNGLGSDRGEQLAWNDDTGAKQVDLAEGRYLVAFTHREGGGGSGIDINFQSPLMGAEATVNPGDPTQSGIWTPYEDYDSHLLKDGLGTLTLHADNPYSGRTEIHAGAIHIRNANALGTGDHGTVVHARAELGLAGGISVNGNAERLDFEACATLANIKGTNGVFNGIHALPDQSGRVKIRSDAGRLNLETVLLAESGLEVFGNGDTVVSSIIEGDGSKVAVTPGLTVDFIDLDPIGLPNTVPDREALIEPISGVGLPIDDLPASVTTNLHLIDFGLGTESVAGDGSSLDRGGSTGNPFGGIGVDVGTDRLALRADGFLLVPEDGSYAITTRSDDGSRAWLDLNRDGCFDESELVADNQTHHGMQNRTQGLFTLHAGYYRFKTAMFEGGGGAGMQVSWEHPDGDNPFGREIITNAFFNGVVAENMLFKHGAGTLTLGSIGFTDIVGNSYDGGTVIRDGLLVANRDDRSTGTGDVLVEDHGRLGGLGVVSGNVHVGPGGGLAPGESPGALTLASGDITFGGVSNNPAWYIAELDGPNSPGGDYDQLLHLGGTFNASNGTLLATHGDGYDPQNGEVLTIVDTDTVLGTFEGLADGASVNASGEEFIINYNDLARDTITLTATGTDLLYAGPDLVFRDYGRDLAIPVGDLLLNDSPSAAGGPVNVIGVQTQTVNGATVSLQNNEISYAVTNTFNGTDTFTYTIQDAGGGTIEGVVTVVVNPPSDAQPPIADVQGLVVIGGMNRVTFLGEPGRQYVIDYTDDLTTEPMVWTPVSGALTPDSGGGFSVDHDSPTAISYYRARTQ